MGFLIVTNRFEYREYFDPKFVRIKAVQGKAYLRLDQDGIQEQPIWILWSVQPISFLVLSRQEENKCREGFSSILCHIRRSATKACFKFLCSQHQKKLRLKSWNSHLSSTHVVRVRENRANSVEIRGIWDLSRTSLNEISCNDRCRWYVRGRLEAGDTLELVRCRMATYGQMGLAYELRGRHMIKLENRTQDHRNI